MTVEELLTKLEDELENAKDSLFSSKVRVDAKELSSIVAEIRMAMPNEILRAKDIIGRESSIISDAQKQAAEDVAKAKERANKITTEVNARINELKIRADELTKKMVAEAEEKGRAIIARAQAQADATVAEHEITRRANETAASHLQQARTQADEIVSRAKEQADNLLSSAQDSKEDEIKLSKEKAETIAADADRFSRELREAAWTYADRIMGESAAVLNQCANSIADSQRKISEALHWVQDMKNSDNSFN